MADLSLRQYLLQKRLDPSKGARQIAPNQILISLRSLILGINPRIENTRSVMNLLVDKDIRSQGGGQKLQGYVPTKNGVLIDRSGVTIGTKVDLGQMNKEQFNALPISSNLKDKLRPYVGLKGQDALNTLNNNPVSIERNEAVSLYTASMDPYIPQIADQYNKATKEGTFERLEYRIVAVIIDVVFHPFDLIIDFTSKVMDYLTQGKWSDAANFLKDSNDENDSRNANNIQDALDNGLPDGLPDPEKNGNEHPGGDDGNEHPGGDDGNEHPGEDDGK
jgi:hypothetical protein